MDTAHLSVHATALAADFRRSLRVARDLGIRGVEIDARHGLDPTQLTQTGLRQIRKWCRIFGR